MGPSDRAHREISVHSSLWPGVTYHHDLTFSEDPLSPVFLFKKEITETQEEGSLSKITLKVGRRARTHES